MGKEIEMRGWVGLSQGNRGLQNYVNVKEGIDLGENCRLVSVLMVGREQLNLIGDFSFRED